MNKLAVLLNFWYFPTCARGGGKELGPFAFGRFEEKEEINKTLIIKKIFKNDSGVLNALG